MLDTDKRNIHVWEIFISLLRTECSFHCTNLNTPHKKVFWAKFALYWPSLLISGEDFWMPFMYFHNIAIISTWKGSSLLHLMSTGLKCFVSSLVVIGPVILKVKFKLWKVHDNNNEDNYNSRQILIRKACLSLQLRRAKNGITGKWKKTHGLKWLNTTGPWVFFVGIPFPDLFLIYLWDMYTLSWRPSEWQTLSQWPWVETSLIDTPIAGHWLPQKPQPLPKHSEHELLWNKVGQNYRTLQHKVTCHTELTPWTMPLW